MHAPKPRGENLSSTHPNHARCYTLGGGGNLSSAYPCHPPLPMPSHTWIISNAPSCRLVLIPQAKLNSKRSKYSFSYLNKPLMITGHLLNFLWPLTSDRRLQTLAGRSAGYFESPRTCLMSGAGANEPRESKVGSVSSVSISLAI